MKSMTTYQLSAAHRQFMFDLWRSDEETGGRPQLRAGQGTLARSYLEDLLINVDVELAHRSLLEEFYQANFHAPLSRSVSQGEALPPSQPSPGFRHNTLLLEERVRAIAELGPAALPEEELPILLLNPLGLWDIADLIHWLLPSYWLERMEEQGRRFLDEYGLDIPIPGTDAEATVVDQDTQLPAIPATPLHGRAELAACGADCWELRFVDHVAKGLARQIAERAYGDLERAFTLRLHRMPAEGDQVRAQVEAEPAPVREDLQLIVTFPLDGVRTFLVKRAEQPRANERSVPCDPLPATAFEIRGTPVWRPNAWPPHLVLL